MKKHTQMYEGKTRENIRLNFFSCISYFADVDIQKKKWLDLKETNPYYTFVECISCYFDDIIYDDGLEGLIDSGLISSKEKDAVLRFHELADKYSSPTDDYDHSAILDDPKWKEIQQEAKHACNQLKTLLKNPLELNQLLPEK